MKWARLLEMQADAPPSARMSKESESKMGLRGPSSEIAAAALARAIPVARADNASRCVAVREGDQRRKRHQVKFHLAKKHLRHQNTKSEIL
jgi:hypothetical protein